MFQLIIDNYQNKVDLSKTIKNIIPYTTSIKEKTIGLTTDIDKKEITDFIISQLALLKYKGSQQDIIDFIYKTTELKIDKKLLDKEVNSINKSFKLLEQDLLEKINEAFDIKDTSLSNYLLKLVKVANYSIKLELVENLILFLDGFKKEMPNKYKKFTDSIQTKKLTTNEKYIKLITAFNAHSIGNKAEPISEDEDFYKFSFKNAGSGKSDVLLYFENEKTLKTELYYSAITNSFEATWEKAQQLEHNYDNKNKIKSFEDKIKIIEDTYKKTSTNFKKKKESFEATFKSTPYYSYKESLKKDADIEFNTENINIFILAINSNINMIKFKDNIRDYLEFRNKKAVKSSIPKFTIEEIEREIIIISQFIFQSSQNSTLYGELMDRNNNNFLDEKYSKNITTSIGTLLDNTTIIIQTKEKGLERIKYPKDIEEKVLIFLEYIQVNPNILNKINTDNIMLSYVYFYFKYKDPKNEKAFDILEKFSKSVGINKIMSNINKDNQLNNQSNQLKEKDALIESKDTDSINDIISEYNLSFIEVINKIKKENMSENNINYAISLYIKVNNINLNNIQEEMLKNINDKEANKSINYLNNRLIKIKDYLNKITNNNISLLDLELSIEDKRDLSNLISNSLNDKLIDKEELLDRLITEFINKNIIECKSKSKEINNLMNLISELYGTDIKVKVKNVIKSVNKKNNEDKNIKSNSKSK
jgi:hypothetical protein